MTFSDLLEVGQDLCSFLPLIQPGPPSGNDLYLSPHVDDVCFSLGNYIAGRGAGLLLNIFTQSSCIPNRAVEEAGRIHELPAQARAVTITALRRKEDLYFAAKVGLHAVYCNLPEAPNRGHDPFDASCVDDDTAQYAAAIMDHIRTLFPMTPGRAPTLYCPMGIGGHLDHLVVRKTVLDNLIELRGLYDVVFYEDLHYASNAAKRRQGLLDFFARVAPKKPWRKALPVKDHQKKLELVGIYLSQIQYPPVKPLDFTPATRAPYNPMHEAVWLL